MEINVIEDNIRIDKYLSEKLDISRNKIQTYLNEEKILVNNQKVNNHYLISKGDIIMIKDLKSNQDNHLKPSNESVDIVYEDDDLLIINKPSGMVVHPAPGNYDNTLVNALIGKYELSKDAFRPGIVHRLDKDTSGLMLVAKNDFIHDKLANMIKDKIVKRNYIALVLGTFPNNSGTIDAPIGRDPKNRQKMTVTSQNSKEAITHFKVLKRYSNATLIECELETGRTHQIRVHMKYIGHPIVNDPLYSKRINNNSFGQLLHSYKISFPHPRTNKIIEFKVDPPKEFNDILNEFVEK